MNYANHFKKYSAFQNPISTISIFYIYNNFFRLFTKNTKNSFLIKKKAIMNLNKVLKFTIREINFRIDLVNY